MPNEIDDLKGADVEADLRQLLTTQGKPEANIGLLLGDLSDKPTPMPEGVLQNINWLEVEPAGVVRFLRENIQSVALIAHVGHGGATGNTIAKVRRGGAEIPEDVSQLPVVPNDGLLDTYGIPTVNLEGELRGTQAFRAAINNRVNFVTRVRAEMDSVENTGMRAFLQSFEGSTRLLKAAFLDFGALWKNLPDVLEKRGQLQIKTSVEELAGECLESIAKIEEVTAYFKQSWPNAMASDMGHYLNNPLGILSANFVYLNTIMEEFLGQKDPDVSRVEGVLGVMARRLKAFATQYPE